MTRDCAVTGTAVSPRSGRSTLDSMSAPTDDLLKAYHRLYETWWLRAATVEIDLPGYNGISYDDTNALNEAAEEVERLLQRDDHAWH